MTTVATVVSEILGDDIEQNIEFTKDQIKQFEEKLSIKSVPRAKVNYVLGDGDAGEVQLAPQAKILLSVLNENPMSLEAWGDAAKEAGMKTTQDPGRIAAYYRKTLVDASLVTEVPAS